MDGKKGGYAWRARQLQWKPPGRHTWSYSGNAVRRANLSMYPNGWAAKTQNFPLSELQPSPHFEVLATASGGYGERVTQASEVQPALQRALRAVREEGRQAVLNMICKHP
jgi:acetolactate synthase-1/2/3 large subunit